MLREIQPQRLPLGEGVVDDAVVALDVARDVVRRVASAAANVDLCLRRGSFAASELLEVVVERQLAVHGERLDDGGVGGARVRTLRGNDVEHTLTGAAEGAGRSEPLRDVR